MFLLATMRVLKLSLATVWAWGLLLAGVWTWVHVRPMAALAPLAAGQFVWLWLVADDLCPRASRGLTVPVKVTVGLVFWMSVAFGVIWSISQLA